LQRSPDPHIEVPDLEEEELDDDGADDVKPLDVNSYLTRLSKRFATGTTSLSSSKFV
jgi:hypothetical protein